MKYDPDEVPRCRHCQKIVEGQESIPRPDPYLYEIHGDETLVVLCDDCHKECLKEI
jgi:hypothetical protein